MESIFSIFNNILNLLLISISCIRDICIHYSFSGFMFKQKLKIYYYLQEQRHSMTQYYQLHKKYTDLQAQLKQSLESKQEKEIQARDARSLRRSKFVYLCDPEETKNTSNCNPSQPFKVPLKGEHLFLINKILIYKEFLVI